MVLSMLVDENGKVKDALVVESHPAQTFDDAALDVVWSWRFQPGEYKGKSVSVVSHKPYVLSLDRQCYFYVCKC